MRDEPSRNVHQADLTVVVAWSGKGDLGALAAWLHEEAPGLDIQLLVADLSAGAGDVEQPSAARSPSGGVWTTRVAPPPASACVPPARFRCALLHLTASRWVLCLGEHDRLAPGDLRRLLLLRAETGHAWMRCQAPRDDRPDVLSGLMFDVVRALPILHLSAGGPASGEDFLKALRGLPGAEVACRMSGRAVRAEDGLEVRPDRYADRYRPVPMASVLIPTVCRSTMLRAVRSALAQDVDGHIEVLVAVDVDPAGRAAALQEQLRRECPSHASIHWIHLPYSTSVRHGGIHASYFGGGLRSAMTWLASSDRLVYLDDDDWLDPLHVRDIVRAANGRAWAYSLCHYADGDREVALGVDMLESVGPGQGVHARRFGGFVRPSGLLIDRRRAPQSAHLWARALSSRGDGDDRLVFDALRKLPTGFTGRASVFYSLDPNDEMHSHRVAYLRSRGADASQIRRSTSTRDNGAFAGVRPAPQVLAGA